MYFACDVCNPKAVCDSLQKRIRERPDLHWMALVDGAFDYQKNGLALTNERYVVYDYDGMFDLREASPYLISLAKTDEPLLEQEIMALARHRKERPMLSFIGSDSTPDPIVTTFRRFANAATTDEQELVLRFADSRVLEGLPGALSEAHWAGLTSRIDTWLIVDRAGRVQPLQMSTKPALISAPFNLSEDEFSELIKNGLVDAVTNALEDTNPEVLPETGRSVFYNNAKDACSFAAAHGVDAFPDVVAIVTLHTVRPGLLTDARLSTLLKGNVWKKGSLIADLVDFVE